MGKYVETNVGIVRVRRLRPEKRRVLLHTNNTRRYERLRRSPWRVPPFTRPLGVPTVVAEVTDEQLRQIHDWGDVEVTLDTQFALTASAVPSAAPWQTKTQADVMRHINAHRAWTITRGAGPVIAVIDTGVNVLPEFRRRSAWSRSFVYRSPWSDAIGHGTMCAAIACGSAAHGGRYDGVAPEADLLSARCELRLSEVHNLLEHLLGLRRDGAFPKGLVVCMSFGVPAAQTAVTRAAYPLTRLIQAATAAGVVFVCSAGNYHDHHTHTPSADRPNSIWGVNSLDDVISVGAVDWDETNQRYPWSHAESSRGPGEWASTVTKPDVVAPTYGEVLYGRSYEHREWWGTSGAAPQVAGLAALLLSINPSFTPAQILQITRQSARRLNAPKTCVGEGIIDCEAALRVAGVGSARGKAVGGGTV